MQTAVGYESTALSRNENPMPLFRRDRLKLIRKDRGVTQQTLANSIGVRQSQIADWERGRFKPEDENIAKLAKALEITMDYLYGLVDRPKDTLKQQGLSPKEYKVINRIRIDKDAERLVDRLLLINSAKEYPALPAPKEGDEDDKTSPAKKEPTED